MKSKMKIILLAVCICIATLQIHAQNVMKLFDDSYSGQVVNLRTDDLPVVYVSSYETSFMEGTDASGTTLWHTALETYWTIGSFLDDENNSVTFHTADGYILKVTKLSETGDFIWEHDYLPEDLGLIDSLNLDAADKNSDNEYAILLRSYEPGASCSDDHYIVNKFSSEGTIIDSFSFCQDDFAIDETYSVSCGGINWDGGQISVIARIRSSDAGKEYLSVISFTEDGTFLSQKNYNGLNTGMMETLSDGYLLGGRYEDTTTASLYDHLGYYLVRTDMDGDTLWAHYYPGSEDDYPRTATFTPSGNLIAVIETYASNDSHLNKYNPDGTIAWSTFIDASDVDLNPYDIAAVSDTRFALSGSLYAPSLYEAFLFLTDSTCTFPVIEIRGKAFYDENDNDVFDGDDVTLYHQYIHAEPDGSGDFTNYYGGDYNTYLLDDVDEVEVYLNPTDVYVQTYPAGGEPHIVEPDLSGGYYLEEDVDFALNFAVEGPNVSTEISAWGVAPGFESHIHVYVHNVGSEEITTGTVTLFFPILFTIESTTPDYLSATDTSVTWEYSDLQIFESKTMHIELLADTSLDIGIEVPFYAVVEPLAGDVNTLNNYDTLVIISTASLDPNNKLVNPPGEGEDGNIDENTESLEYTINFQNTGTSEAHFVVLVDTFSNYLDISTIQMLGASHQFTMDVPAPNVVKWIFNDINLPDSTTDLLGSMGNIKFRINIKDAATIGTVIENSAAIYFDYNPAVITNTTKSTLILENPDAVEEMNADKFLCTVFPNPASDIINISFASSLLTDMQYSIADITGKEIINGNIIKGENGFSINVERLPAGLYHFILIQNNAIIAKTKFGIIPK